MQQKQLDNLESASMDSTQTTDKCTCCQLLVPLTDEQIQSIIDLMPTYDDWGRKASYGNVNLHDFALAIESAVRSLPPNAQGAKQ